MKFLNYNYQGVRLIGFISFAMMAFLFLFGGNTYAATMPEPADFTNGNDIMLSVSRAGLGNGLDAPESLVVAYFTDPNPANQFAIIENYNNCTRPPDTNVIAPTTYSFFAANTDGSRSSVRLANDVVSNTRSGSCQDIWVPFSQLGNLTPAVTFGGTTYYMVYIQARHTGVTGSGGQNAFKLHTPSGYIGYSNSSDVRFALQARYPYTNRSTTLRDYNIRFGTACSITSASSVSLRWWDDDIGSSAQPTPITMSLIEQDKSGTTISTTPLSPTWAGDNAPGSVTVTLQPNRTYLWRWSGVADSNGIQFAVPFDSVYSQVDCNAVAATGAGAGAGAGAAAGGTGSGIVGGVLDCSAFNGIVELTGPGGLPFSDIKLSADRWDWPGPAPWPLPWHTGTISDAEYDMSTQSVVVYENGTRTVQNVRLAEGAYRVYGIGADNHYDHPPRNPAGSFTANQREEGFYVYFGDTGATHTEDIPLALRTSPLMSPRSSPDDYTDGIFGNNDQYDFNDNYDYIGGSGRYTVTNPGTPNLNDFPTVIQIPANGDLTGRDIGYDMGVIDTTGRGQTSMLTFLPRGTFFFSAQAHSIMVGTVRIVCDTSNPATASYNLTPRVTISPNRSFPGSSVAVGYNVCTGAGDSAAPGIDMTITGQGSLPSRTVNGVTVPGFGLCWSETDTVTIPIGTPPGTRWCTTLTASRTSNADDTDISAQACLDVIDNPYLRVYGYDIVSGGVIAPVGDAPCSTVPASVRNATSNLQSVVRGFGATVYGAAVQYSARVSGGPLGSESAITSFGTRNDANSGALAYANGDQFSPTGECVPNLYDRAVKAAGPGVSLVGNINDIVTAADRDQQFVLPSGNVTITNQFQNWPDNTVVVIDGDLAINGNITYAGSYANKADIPSLIFIVRGNISIARTVDVIDGLYAATPTVLGGGVISTCGGGRTNTSRNYCNRQLRINGSFVAQKVDFLRTDRTIGAAASCGNTRACHESNAAELFLFSPELYIAKTSLITSSTSALGDIEQLRDLPPVVVP